VFAGAAASPKARQTDIRMKRARRSFVLTIEMPLFR
jgi:hypothetical protein